MQEVAESTGFIYEFGKFALDPQERTLLVDGRAVHLADKVFDTLLLLIHNNGKLLSKDEMMSSLWEESYVEESNLAKNISRLRKILNTDGAKLIETLPKRGYRFNADLNERDGEVLVKRRLRVKVIKTIDDGGSSSPYSPALALKAGPRLDVRLLATAVTAVMIAAAGVSYYFLRNANTPDASGMINLTNNLAEDSLPVWSPDGSKIAFISNRDGAGDIYLMDADGSHVMRLTGTQAAEGSAAWSPDGTKIAFDSERDGNREIYLMNADGSDQTRLTFNPSSDVGPVSFSPDGKQLAFARNTADVGMAAFLYDVFVMNVDGTGVRQLTTDPEFDAEPSWSPDGVLIHFISARDGNFELYSINADGTHETNLSRAPRTREGTSKFVSDGRYFYIVGEEGAFLNQIYTVDPNDVSRRQVTSFTEFVTRFSVSESARKFALSVKKDGNSEIFLMDARTLLEPKAAVP